MIKIQFSKTVALTIGALIVGGALGGGGTYAVMHKNDAKSSSQSNELKAVSNTPEDPSFVDKRTTNAIGTLPEGVLDASNVANSPFQYSGQSIQVRGYIINAKGDEYSLVGQSGDKPAGLPLDFGKSNIDPKKYTQGSPATTKQGEQPALPSPVTVTGKVTESTNNGVTVFKLEVTEVK